jgi:hypothetical protein
VGAALRVSHARAFLFFRQSAAWQCAGCGDVVFSSQRQKTGAELTKRKLTAAFVAPWFRCWLFLVHLQA